mmetsp:Transcript_5276/g.17316  ORF Transcript_5276/g.17316 Transcript_5276/m.17316 type:complete len:227 (+) Transcript_5276:285-965(+)
MKKEMKEGHLLLFLKIRRREVRGGGVIMDVQCREVGKILCVLGRNGAYSRNRILVDVVVVVVIAPDTSFAEPLAFGKRRQRRIEAVKVRPAVTLVAEEERRRVVAGAADGALDVLLFVVAVGGEGVGGRVPRGRNLGVDLGLGGVVPSDALVLGLDLEAAPLPDAIVELYGQMVACAFGPDVVHARNDETVREGLALVVEVHHVVSGLRRREIHLRRRWRRRRRRR